MLARWYIYIDKITNLQPNMNLTWNNFFLRLNIALQDFTFTINMIYSPGQPMTVAQLFNHLKQERDSFIIIDFNAHYEQCYGLLAADFSDRMMNDTANTNIICEWFAKNSFTLLNTAGKAIHFSFNSNSPSIFDLCYTSGRVMSLPYH